MKSKISQKQLIFLFLSLIIPLLITGPFLPDLLLSISSLIFLLFLFKKKQWFLFNKTPVILFIIFCIYIIFCSLLSEDIFLSFQSSLFYFRIGTFCCLIWYLIDKDKNILIFFYYALLFSFLILIIDGYFQFFFDTNLLGYQKQTYRIASLFGDEYVLGSYLSRLFPLFFALFIIKNKNKYETFYVSVVFILTEILIYISGERTAFFFLNLSTIFIIGLIKKYWKLRIICLVISMMLIAFLTLTNQNLAKRMIIGPLETIGIHKNSQKIYFFSPVHDSLARTAFNIFLDNPVNGHGPKMFRKICEVEKYRVGELPCSTHPHNFYIQLLAETGLIGFSFLFSVFIYVIFCAVKQLISIFKSDKRYMSDYQICLLAGILVSIWPFSPNGNFFNNWLMIIYSLPFGFYLQSIFSSKNKY